MMPSSLCAHTLISVASKSMSTKIAAIWKAYVLYVPLNRLIFNAFQKFLTESQGLDVKLWFVTIVT